jgi:O-antigen ligase
VYNPLLAFGFYLICHEMFWGGLRNVARLSLAAIALLMAFNMFITEGRTGQIAFFVLFGLLVFQALKKRIVWAVLIVAGVLPLLIVSQYHWNPTFHSRVDAVVEEVGRFKTDPNTSVGLRLLFWQNSLPIIQQTPLFGVGTGDFQQEYAQVNSQHSPTMVATDNPHNQYIFDLCRFGLAGLIALLLIFFLQVREAIRFQDGWQRIRLAFPLFFMTIMLAESYLVVYQTGFFFSLFGAVLYLRPASPSTQAIQEPSSS